MCHEFIQISDKRLRASYLNQLCFQSVEIRLSLSVVNQFISAKLCCLPLYKRCFHQIRQQGSLFSSGELTYANEISKREGWAKTYLTDGISLPPHASDGSFCSVPSNLVNARSTGRD